MTPLNNAIDYSLVILNYIPVLLFGLTVLIIGWILAVAIGKLIAEILKKIKLDEFLDSYGWHEILERARIKLKVSEFIGGLVKWIIIILTLSVFTEILGLSQFTQLLQKFATWIPTILVTVLILIVAVIVADILEKLVRSFCEKAQLKAGPFLGSFLKWLVYILAVMIVLSQLKIGEKFVTTLFTGLVATFAISFGLAFGLGGKGVAEDILRDLQKKISEKE